MSINAISGISIYEYYYKINKEEQEKKQSPLEREMQKYGLTPTDNETLNIILLKKAKEAKEEEKGETQLPNSSRPWADIMYQLNIPFNPDPKDDIDDIKDELAKLMVGMDDDELRQDITDLEDRVERLYVDFQQRNVKSFDNSFTLSTQLNNLSMINQINLF